MRRKCSTLVVALTLALALVPRVLEAQPVATAAWTFLYCSAPAVAATCAPVASVSVALSQVQCNQVPTPAPSPPPVNPTTLEWHDPFVLPVASRACVTPRPQPAPGSPLAAGSYLGILVANGAAPGPASASGRSAPTAVFDIQVALPPLTPTGVIVRE